jgi:thioredoxin-like negative regulator of GroEL
VGCEIYRFAARLRGVRSRRIDSVDLAELGASTAAGEIVVQFTHPLCTDCHSLEAELRAAGRTVVTVDVSRRPELARKYGVALVPTAVAVTSSGTVVERLA